MLNYNPMTEALPFNKHKSLLETFQSDPIHVQRYTLKNGLQLFMSVNRAEPRVFTNIAVRAGSKQDPSETTGLAHYLEHMMFKGSSQIGALDWHRESALLKKISDLYERRRLETDPAVRASIYKEIDQISAEAATLVAANEYDKLAGSLGARATNAYTSNDQTVYVNDVPSNELERWMQLESERFKMVVLRLFHTELETVFEEFNISQDVDQRKAFAAMNEALFPNHPYGLQTTLGKAEHLKNPSPVNIHQFFDRYYAPNNMAVVLSGDFDPDQAVRWVEKYFGSLKMRAFDTMPTAPLPPLHGVQKKEVFGQQAEFLQIGWRFEGAQSDCPDMLQMIVNILSNGQAGLFDLNFIQKQKLLEARAAVNSLTDFTVLLLWGKPREGQTLEEVQSLLMQEIENLKQGKFPDWLPQAIVNDLKYTRLKHFENNSARTSAIANAFVKGVEWSSLVNQIDRISHITKSQIVDFANAHLGDQHAVVFKRHGEDKNVVKVEKPAITAVQLNRTDQSDYAAAFLQNDAPRLKPEFTDYSTAILKTPLKNGLTLDYVKNTLNETFSLYYILEMGKNSDPLLPLAIAYLPFLGTDRYTAEQLQQEFYKRALAFDVSAGDERVYISLSGLEEYFTEGLQLFEHILQNARPDADAFKKWVADLLTKRENAKKDKRAILQYGLANYARYGARSPFTDLLLEDRLRQLDPQQLTDVIHQITSFQHQIYYYGSREAPEIAGLIDREHIVPETLRPLLPAKKYPELTTEKDRIYFLHFPMVQMELMALSKGTPFFNRPEQAMASYYNHYFGSGLSSIVFQEIRESKALAYSAYAQYITPQRKDRAHYLQAYIGTQPDKLKEAFDAMRQIIEEMPVLDSQLRQSREAALKQLESARTPKSNIYWNYKAAQLLGFDYDYRKDIYRRLQDAAPEDLMAFQGKYVKNRNYTYLILGDRAKADMDFLSSVGEVKELTLEEVFGY